MAVVNLLVVLPGLLCLVPDIHLRIFVSDPPDTGLWVLFLVPLAAFFTLRCIFAPIALVECKLRPVAALRESWALSSGHFWRTGLFLAALTAVFMVMALVLLLISGIMARPYAELVSLELLDIAAVIPMAFLACYYQELRVLRAMQALP